MLLELEVILVMIGRSKMQSILKRSWTRSNKVYVYTQGTKVTIL